MSSKYEGPKFKVKDSKFGFWEFDRLQLIVIRFVPKEVVPEICTTR